MTKFKRNFKITLAYFIGNVFDKALAFLTIPIFTKLLNPTEYGIVGTYLSWVGVLSVVITLSLGNSIRTAVTDFPGEEKKYISSVFFLGTLSFVIMTFIIVLVSLLIGFSNYLVLIICCCFHSYGSSIIMAVQWKNMMKLEYIKRTLLQSLPNLIVVALSILLILSLKDNKFYGRIFAFTIVYGALSILLVVYYFAKGKCYLNKKYLLYSLSFSIPIIFHSLSSIVLAQSDRIMISMLYTTSETETGLYTLAYQFGMVPIVVMTTLENVWIPWFTKEMESNNSSKVKTMVIPYILVVAFVCVLLMLVSPEVLKIMSSSDYYSATIMIAPVIFGHFLMFVSSILIDYEYYKKQTIIISISTLIAAIVNIVLNLILIPKFGGLAAAYTTAISYFVMFLLHFVILKVKKAGLFDAKTFFIPILVLFFLMIVSILLIQDAFTRWKIAFCFIILSFITALLWAEKHLNNKKIKS